jgi:methylmalonyl-CoA/ethylmalonyl-CoA epimerase
MKLHHLGFVVNDIESFSIKFPEYINVKSVKDSYQNAYINILKRSSDELLIELIQPLNNNSFVHNALNKFGDHFNHFCYEIQEDAQLTHYAESNRLKKLIDWVEAPVFDNRMVCFYFNRKGQVLEFIK